MNKLVSFLSSFAVAALFCVPAAHAAYPDHPVKLMTMTGPGAQIDLVTRALADKFKDYLGQPVVVDNKPGGSHGSVMATELASAAPDGYTFTYSPHFVSTKYKLDDFKYLSLIGLNQSGIICKPDRPWNTLKEAFAWAKKEGKGLTYMFQGSDDRDAMKRIAAQEGVKLSLMPSTGGPSIITAVMGGHADIGHVGAILFDYVASGKIKCIAATIPTRLTELPDIPTLKSRAGTNLLRCFLCSRLPRDFLTMSSQN